MPRAPTVLSFTATPVALPYGGGDVTLSWQAADATGLSIEPGIGPVSGSARTVSVATSTRFTLTARNEAGSATAETAVAVDTRTAVSGKVVDVTGHPLPNVLVTPLDGSGAFASTDLEGEFQLASVSPPYDLALVANNAKVATVYVGLTRDRVTLTQFNQSASHGSATLHGTISGGQPPYASDGTNAPMVFFSAPGGTDSLEASPDGPTAYFTGAFFWQAMFGQTSVTGTLYALQPVRSAPGAIPSRYAGFGQRDNVTLTAGTHVFNIDLAMGSVGNSTLGGHVGVPNGYALSSTAVFAAFRPEGVASLFRDPLPTATFSYPVPNLPRARFSLYATATSRTGATAYGIRAGLSAGSTSALGLQDTPHPARPFDRAAGITRATPFVWSPYAGGVHLLELWSTSHPSYQLVVVTADNAAVLPDLSRFGMGLPADASFQWRVEGVAPFASVDALVDGPRLPRLLSLLADGTCGSSELRSFTTAASP
ncbi:MAG TPA: hypothetical protein VK420_02905 [Longimicrobium sp.]|nr:hypothetical protein [Longimicrobium sp.]